MEHTEKTHSLALVARFIRRRWRLPLQVGGASLGLMALMGASAFQVSSHRQEPAPKGPEVAEGVVESLLAKGVGGAFDGAVEGVAVREGQQVKKGDLLFRLDTRALHAQLASVEAARAGALNELRRVRAERRADLAAAEQEIAALRAEKAGVYRQIAQAKRQAREEARAALEAAQANGTLQEGVQYEAEVRLDVDQAQLYDLEIRMATAQANLAQRRQAWTPLVQSAEAAFAAADREVKNVRTLIAGATRRSPMAGVVTGVYARPGQTVAAGQPVVRVDDPKGYRVVTLVDQKWREALKPGLVLTMERGDARAPVRLEKIEAGEDRELFTYYLWLKPEQPRTLRPGEQVEVVVPKPSMTASAEL